MERELISAVVSKEINQRDKTKDALVALDKLKIPQEYKDRVRLIFGKSNVGCTTV